MFPPVNRSPNPNRHLDRFSPFRGAHYTVTDRPTDRPRYTRCVTIGRIYVRSTAMQPNNNLIYNADNVDREMSIHRRGKRAENLGDDSR